MARGSHRGVVRRDLDKKPVTRDQLCQLCLGMTGERHPQGGVPRAKGIAAGDRLAPHGVGDQVGIEPMERFALAAAVPAGRVVACGIAAKLSDGHRDRMRAGRPRSQGMLSRRRRGECLAGDLSIGFMQEPALPAGQPERTDLGRDSHCFARSRPIKLTTQSKWCGRTRMRPTSKALKTAPASWTLPRSA